MSSDEYYKNFGIKKKYSNIIKIKCKQLNKKGFCNIWKKKTFPKHCYYFPVPNDRMYWEVFNKCSFYFEIIEELKVKGELK